MVVGSPILSQVTKSRMHGLTQSRVPMSQRGGLSYPERERERERKGGSVGGSYNEEVSYLSESGTSLSVVASRRIGQR